MSSYLTWQPLFLYDLVTASGEVPREYNMYAKVCSAFVCRPVLYNFELFEVYYSHGFIIASDYKLILKKPH